MALYIAKDTKKDVVGYYPTDDTLILVEDKPNSIDRTAELPSVKRDYWKVENGFFVEMTDDEKITADEQELTELKELKKLEVKEEAQRRIKTSPSEDEEGAFVGVDEVKQRNYLAHAVSLLREALTIDLGYDPITKLSQEKQEIYNNLLDATWVGVQDVRSRSNLIEAEDIDLLDNVEEIKNVKIKDNPKWSE